MESGESPQQAAVREIKEELGCLLELSKLVYLTVHADDEAKSHLFHYPIADELQGATLTEGQAIRFMTLAEIQDQNVIPRHREILEWYQHIEPQPRDQRPQN